MLVECQDGTFRKSKLKDCSAEKLTAMKQKCKGKDKKKKEKEDKKKEKRDCDKLATPAKVANCKKKQGIAPEETTYSYETTTYF